MSEHAQPDEITIREDEWVSANQTYRLVSGLMGDFQARVAICTRAHHGLIQCRAERLIIGRESRDNAEVPKEFWWANGQKALTQNWKTGDFSTWMKNRLECKAFGVTFLRNDVQKLIPDGQRQQETKTLPQYGGGRPPAEWWDDLWVEICRQLYVGDLQAHKQADIEKAMHDWLASQNHSASTSTIRQRARKLWAALAKDDE